MSPILVPLRNASVLRPYSVRGSRIQNRPIISGLGVTAKKAGRHLLDLRRRNAHKGVREVEGVQDSVVRSSSTGPDGSGLLELVRLEAQLPILLQSIAPRAACRLCSGPPPLRR
jgi:hypothetical protein